MCAVEKGCKGTRDSLSASVKRLIGFRVLGLGLTPKPLSAIPTPTVFLWQIVPPLPKPDPGLFSLCPRDCVVARNPPTRVQLLAPLI